MKIGIIGLGLMGGSMALALKKNSLAKKIYGYDLSITNCEDALDLNLVDEIVSFKELLELDVIFLAIPVEGIIKVLPNLKNVNKNCTIIDLGSTKEKIVKSIPKEIRKNFVPAHPMAGRETNGPKSAIDNLYEKANVVLCDVEECEKSHLEKAKNIFRKIGMRIIYMDSHSHDRHAAFISHMPHIVSYALANCVMKQEDPKSILALAVGGFKSMSRIAKSSPEMWSDVSKQNRENLLETIDAFSKELEIAKKLIEKEEWESLKEWMRDATRLHRFI